MAMIPKEVIEEMAYEYNEYNVSLTTGKFFKYMTTLEKIKDNANRGLIGGVKLVRICNRIDKSVKKHSIRFDDKDDFMEFARAMAELADKDKEDIICGAEHEIVHSKPYIKSGISVRFGYSKLKGKKKNFFLYCMPYGEKWDSLSDQTRDLITYESLMAVSNPSIPDLEQLKYLKNKLGKNDRRLIQIKLNV